MPKKNLRTIKETLKGGNVKSINKKTLEKKKNAELIKKADANKLPGYHTDNIQIKCLTLHNMKFI